MEMTTPAAGNAQLRNGMLASAAAIAATLSAILLAYFDTLRSMVVVWLSTDTYIHCFVILPISAYLIWRKWPDLRRLSPAPYLPGVFVLLGLSLIWLVSDFIGVQLGKHFAVVAMVPAAVVAMTGRRYAGTIAFPLGYLVFAVPFGELLIPHLVDYTAAFTVSALNLTGIPVIRDGIYFSIPAGNFEVARACSGVRYLLATLALGTLYAYLTYNSRRKRLIFLLISFVLPIIANGLRAYGIVLLAHYSDMKIAVGVDHLIFGWIFFGIVITILFVIGSRFSDDQAEAPPADADALMPQQPENRRTTMLPALSLTLLFVVAAPVLATMIDSRSQDYLPTFASLPGNIPGWQASNTFDADFQPRFVGASRELFASYTREGRQVNLAVVQYARQRQGAELASFGNVVLDKTRFRKIGKMKQRHVEVGAEFGFPVRELLANRTMSQGIVWYWFSVNGQPVSSDIQVKLQEGMNLLRGRASTSSAIIIGLNVMRDLDSDRSLLQEFLAASYGPVNRCLTMIEQHPDCSIGSVIYDER